MRLLSHVIVRDSSIMCINIHVLSLLTPLDVSLLVGRACSCCIYIRSLGAAWFTGPAAPQHPRLELVLRRMSHDILFSSARFWHISPENTILVPSRAIYKWALFRRCKLQYIASCRLKHALISQILLQCKDDLNSDLIPIRWLYTEVIKYYFVLCSKSFLIPVNLSDTGDIIRKKSTRLFGGQADAGVWFGALQKREGDWCLCYPLDETQIPKLTYLKYVC